MLLAQWLLAMWQQVIHPRGSLLYPWSEYMQGTLRQSIRQEMIHKYSAWGKPDPFSFHNLMVWRRILVDGYSFKVLMIFLMLGQSMVAPIISMAWTIELWDLTCRNWRLKDPRVFHLLCVNLHICNISHLLAFIIPFDRWVPPLQVLSPVQQWITWQAAIQRFLTSWCH